MAAGSLILSKFALGAIQFGLGVLAENAGEWLFHRYVLHGLGRRAGSPWHYHFGDHHRAARAHGMLDPCYRGWPLRWDTHGKEVAFLLVVAVAHGLLWAWAPGYVAGMWAALAVYYARHRRAHVVPGWGRAHLRWHYDHHMGDAEANWCIAWPWLDWLAGTRR